MGYSRLQLKELIRLAKELGFFDDVKHWEAELAKLDNKEN